MEEENHDISPVNHAYCIVELGWTEHHQAAVTSEYREKEKYTVH